MRIRHLHAEEVELAEQVFADTLPYSSIRITDGLGLGGAAWVLWTPWNYLLHLGPHAYERVCGDSGREAMLIHELTHVWDSAHSLVPFGYMLNSAFHQALSTVMHRGNRDYAYQYSPGRPWKSYAAEQKAMIVEDWWYLDQMAAHSVRFRYIEQNIRRGNNQ